MRSPASTGPQQDDDTGADQGAGGVPAAIEAILMVADEPVSATRLAAVLAVPRAVVLEALHALSGQYAGRGFVLREVGRGWRFYSHPDYADVVTEFVRDGQTARLTQAALETLAVVAYRQPISRGRIAGIRGVNVDSVVRTLTTRGLVTETGTDVETGAVLYATTDVFLERLGLRGLDELPPLAPYLPEVEALDDVDAPR
ncbi:SMC-Scp complex subunit ScpB [Pseudactinotalea sp. HY158]|uniref:SMC-Scp complex subunit ScpB n=1 Tax=Pseudactinotalea sp. HY158 TaxID=2654547 RepID=UPI00129D17B7|nr:SMC-Scp complex subunit ScpB [Pseudactinotalea sp. HY158]QGH69246.1 SMC-Scp complex subunit ScpB [Pseudactinotalea sp. HY158]